MPEGLTQTKTATSKIPAGFISECRPASFRNGGRLQIGIPGRNKSESALADGFRADKNDVGGVGDQSKSAMILKWPSLA